MLICWVYIRDMKHLPYLNTTLFFFSEHAVVYNGEVPGIYILEDEHMYQVHNWLYFNIPRFKQKREVYVTRGQAGSVHTAVVIATTKRF